MRRMGWIGAGVLAGGFVVWAVTADSSRPPVESPEDKPRIKAGASRGPPARTDAEGATEAATGSCGHPFIPTSVGAWRRYRLHAGGAETATLTMRATEVRDVGKELEVSWHLRVDSKLFGTMRYRSTRRCDPGGAAQEPWFATTAGGFGIELVDQSWRWPRSLRNGLQFGGTSRLVRAGHGDDEPAGRVEREHTVLARERIDVPAGSFEAWRVAVVERSEGDIGEATWRRTVWVAREVGLVRSVLSTPQGEIRHELMDLGSRSDGGSQP